MKASTQQSVHTDSTLERAPQPLGRDMFLNSIIVTGLVHVLWFGWVQIILHSVSSQVVQSCDQDHFEQVYK